ncbi:replication factor A-related protein, putative [Theileria annulata]|uniref:Replication factor A-related protein, putative n=1 Tax=Theileria annulata TaxID=5874 RepID=Q4UEE5_THEAN|nr:replication factor A-related protein, putative [Theileria annulata]CAI74544.1 replication factor A-related protein, putative [Theileria annulata]|eukprot:XP_952276.1 replication factor A-related protein, putative [Theileria annulata]
MANSYFPIKNITTYTSNWTILGKVVEKSPLKSLKGDNAFLFVDIVDKNGDTIRAKFWGLAANKWNDLLEKGNVYTFSKGSVNLSNKKFNNTPHNYEITFGTDGVIDPSDELDDINVERNYEFVTLRDIKSTSRDTPFVVDILCFVKSLTPVSVTNTKFNRDTKKRLLYVVDDTSYELEVTLWGQMTELPIFDDILDKPVILSQVTIKEWNGGRFGQTSLTTDIKLADFQSVRNKDRLSTLEAWYQKAMSENETFKTMKTQTMSSSRDSYEFSTIEDAMTRAKGYFTFNCKLRKLFWKNKDGDMRLWYHSCPNCYKKVVEEQENVWRCITCDDSIVTPVLRYIVTCVFVDFSGQMVSTVYSDNGKKLLGYTEQELDAMDKEQLKNTLDFDVLHRDFKVSGFFKNKTYNGESRNIFNVTNVEEVDYAKETELLLEKMQITYESVENFLSLGNPDSQSSQKKTKFDQQL